MLANSASRASSNRNEIYGLGERDMRFEMTIQCIRTSISIFTLTLSQSTKPFQAVPLQSVSLGSALRGTVSETLLPVTIMRLCRRDRASTSCNTTSTKFRSTTQPFPQCPPSYRVTDAKNRRSEPNDQTNTKEFTKRLDTARAV
jgi:hypothetical protein